jgi:WD40 repeat protein
MIRFALVTALALVGVSTIAMAQQPAANAAPVATPVRCLCFSRDGKSLAVAYGGTNSLIVWNLASRKPTYSGRENAEIRAVAYSSLGDLLAVGVGPMTKLVDPKTDRVIRELNGQQQLVRSVAFSSDGRWLATGGADHTVKLWDWSTGTLQQTFAGPKGHVLGVAISPDVKWLAAACGNVDAVHLWNLERPMQPPRTIDFPGRAASPSMGPARRADMPQAVFSPDGRLLAIPDWEQGFISIVEVATGNLKYRFRSMNGWKCVAISPDGKWLAAAPTYDRTIRFVPFGQVTTDEQEREIAALIATFHNDDYAKREAASQQLAALGPMAIKQLRAHLDSTSAEVRVRCRRLMERIQNLDFAEALIGHEADPTWVAFSPDGRLLASGDSKGVVKLWTIPDGKDAGTLTPDGNFTPPASDKAARQSQLGATPEA